MCDGTLADGQWLLGRRGTYRGIAAANDQGYRPYLGASGFSADLAPDRATTRCRAPTFSISSAAVTWFVVAVIFGFGQWTVLLLPRIEPGQELDSIAT